MKEEREVTFEEAQRLKELRGAKILKESSNKDDKGNAKVIVRVKLTKEEQKARKQAEADAKAQKKVNEGRKALDRLRGKVEAPAPMPPPVPLEGTPVTLTEFPIGSSIGIELTRVVQGTTKRVTIRGMTTKIKADRLGRLPKSILFVMFKVEKQYRLYYVDPKKIIEVMVKNEKTYKLVFDIMWPYPLNADGALSIDEDLEMILADSAMDQYITIAASQGGFAFTPTLQKAMLLVAFLGLLIGLAANGSMHIVPTTIIHWIP